MRKRIAALVSILMLAAFGPIALAAPPAAAGPVCPYTYCGSTSVLRGGNQLNPGDWIASNPAQYQVPMQSDGNFVVYDQNGQARWASKTDGNSGAFITMQTDGNLVIYRAGSTCGCGSQALWASGTAGNPGAYVTIQSDGNLVIYNASGGAIWATGQNGRLNSGESLHSGQSLGAPGYSTVMQSDGNLVTYDSSNRAIWATRTNNNPGAFVVMQSDGNLVVYRAGSTCGCSSEALWASNTSGNPGAWLSLHGGGILVVSSSGGSPLWSTGSLYNPGNDYPWSPLCTFGDCPSNVASCDYSTGTCSDPWGMAYGQCVSFVAWKIYELYGGTQRPSTTGNRNWWPSNPGVNGDPVNGNWGNASQWATSAANAGFTVTSSPAVGDVAQWGYDKGMGSNGHVMMVVAVSQGNYITVEGYNTHLNGSYGKWNIPWNDQYWSSGNSYGNTPPWPDHFLVVHP